MIDLAFPPATPVSWRCTHAATFTYCIVEAQTWYRAREKAAALMGAEPGQVECSQICEEKVQCEGNQ